VIDAKELAVALDLLLHGCLVADDEAILHEGFERLIERFGVLRELVEPPGGIGTIFVFERRTAFLQRLPARRSNVALARPNDRCSVPTADSCSATLLDHLVGTH
jgi:hypothetical protein